MAHRLGHATAWVFDLDGTLTEAVHDFDGMRRRLGLAPGSDILTEVAALPDAERARAHEVLAAWEWELAEIATEAPGAGSLLSALEAAGHWRGVLTRNRRDIALRTLEVTGLAPRLPRHDVLGRDCAAPKPSPDGVLALLSRWGRGPRDAVMVGNDIGDVRAGRAAGAATVLVHPDPPRDWRAESDVVVSTCAELLGLWQEQLGA